MRRRAWVALALPVVLPVVLPLMLVAHAANAQVPFRVSAGDSAAGAGPALAVGRDTATMRFDVGGVRVILRRNPATDVVAANLYLLGGTRQLTDSTAGIEALLLATAERGSRRYPGDLSRAALARTGSTIATDVAEDWSLLSLRTLRSALDSSWAVLADRVMAPTLDPASVEVVRRQMLNAHRQRRLQPDAEVTALAESLLYAGHPYARDPLGTERSITRMTVRELRRYQEEQVVTSRMLLVVVGNVDRAGVSRLVGRTLARLPRGSYRWTLPPVPAAGGAQLILRRQLPTNYILGYFPGPAPTSPDYAALRVASAVLSGSLFAEIRGRQNLTYAVDAPFVEHAASAGGLYVTTVAPDSVLRLMRVELAVMQQELLDPEGLQRLVGRFITDFFLKNETNADQANFLARAELYQGDYRAAARFVDDLRQVTPAQVRQVATRYWKDLRWVYLGDPAKLNTALLW